MKFGIMNLFPGGAQDAGTRILSETLEEVVLADELGFDSVWLAEHHFSEYGVLGNPFVFGAACAERTKRVSIGTAVVVLPFHDPIRVAEDAAVLDALSGGRFQLGIGRGYQSREFAGFGIDPNTAKDRYDEAVDILELAWTQENWSYHGQFNDFTDVTVYPRPFREGGPPILHGAISPETYSRRGLAGERIITSPSFTPMVKIKTNFDLYRDSLIEGGHDPSGFDLPMMQQVWCGSSETELRATADASLGYYRMLGKVVPGSDEAIASERDYYRKVKENINLLTLEQALTHGGNFGSVQQTIDTLAGMRNDLGVTHYIGWFRIPGLDRSVALRAMETFGTEVIPALRASIADDSRASLAG